MVSIDSSLLRLSGSLLLIIGYGILGIFFEHYTFSFKIADKILSAQLITVSLSPELHSRLLNQRSAYHGLGANPACFVLPSS